MKCYICNGEYNEADLEPIFTGRRRMVCFRCLRQGDKQIKDCKGSYFISYDGKRRIENSKKKGG